MMMRRNEARICIALVVAASGCADVTAPLARTATVLFKINENTHTMAHRP